MAKNTWSKNSIFSTWARSSVALPAGKRLTTSELTKSPCPHLPVMQPAVRPFVSPSAEIARASYALGVAIRSWLHEWSDELFKRSVRLFQYVAGRRLYWKRAGRRRCQQWEIANCLHYRLGLQKNRTQKITAKSRCLLIDCC